MDSVTNISISGIDQSFTQQYLPLPWTQMAHGRHVKGIEQDLLFPMAILWLGIRCLLFRQAIT